METFRALNGGHLSRPQLGYHFRELGIQIVLIDESQVLAGEGMLLLGLRQGPARRKSLRTASAVFLTSSFCPAVAPGGKGMLIVRRCTCLPVPPLSLTFAS